MDKPTITANPEPGVLVRLDFHDGSRVDLSVDGSGEGPPGCLARAWADATMGNTSPIAIALGEAMAAAIEGL